MPRFLSHPVRGLASLGGLQPGRRGGECNAILGSPSGLLCGYYGAVWAQAVTGEILQIGAFGVSGDEVLPGPARIVYAEHDQVEQLGEVGLPDAATVDGGVGRCAVLGELFDLSLTAVRLEKRDDAPTEYRCDEDTSRSNWSRSSLSNQ